MNMIVKANNGAAIGIKKIGDDGSGHAIVGGTARIDPSARGPHREDSVHS
jgi:hypothetical protein